MNYTWNTNRPYNAYSTYIKKTFGGRIQKVSLDAGFTCPNRDGLKGFGGCSYCNNKGFNPSYCDKKDTIIHQLNEGLKFLEERYSPKKFVAYFQAFSNTYADLNKLNEIYEIALSHPKIEGLVIGTRPDCLDIEKINLLNNYAQKYFVQLEIGIESCYNKTLKRINRGHTFEETINCLELLKSTQIHIGTHLIFGLPGETREEMLDESEIISNLPINSIKFHQLQIIKDTSFEKEYLSNPGEFELFELDEYIDFIIKFLERLNPEILVERLSSEAPPNMRIAPSWGMKRIDVIQNMIESRMIKLKTFQGKMFKKY